MAIEIEKIDKFLSTSGLHYFRKLSNPQRSYERVELYTDPLPIAGAMEHSLAKKIAERYEINLVHRDFESKEDEPPEFQPAFSAYITNPSELEVVKKKLDQAKKELEEKLESLAESTMSD